MKTGPRIIATTTDGLLIELDAENGEPVRSYGKNGVVDLKAGVTEGFGGQYEISAPPDL